MDFFKFPSIPHLIWLADTPARHDKVFTKSQADDFLKHELIVEEKIDGANLGLFLDNDGQLRVQNRGSLIVDSGSGQFKRLKEWLDQNRALILEKIPHDVIIFGEWCAATHSIFYSRLPDFFLVFDIYSRKSKSFLSSEERNELIFATGLHGVPEVGRGRFTMDELKFMVTHTSSNYSDDLIEGVVLKQTTPTLSGRAKLVRPSFSQSIEDHWRTRSIKWNRIA